MCNPFLPLNEYIPDGEPHVFGDRVYLYGSHDKQGGKRFCELDYVVYSAEINNLEHWDYHGISYKKSQDPRSTESGFADYYAPDCVKGNDGRYYLYYVAMGPNTRNFGPIAVAVSDNPEGPFEYLGDIQYPDGNPVLKYLTNDPAVINDDGRIYLYYGWGLGRDFRSKLLTPLYNTVQSKLYSRSVKEIKSTKPNILSCAFAELENDMLTVKSEPISVLDSKTTADKKSELYNHAFYEAPSIRKFNNTYYLIYSSGENNELAYAMSKYPNKGFEYKGVLISNSDLGYLGNKNRLAPAGTIHGSIEYINSDYYIFYHRCTHNTDFSRQACMERITMNSDGTFDQVEVTTQGSGNSLNKGKYPAAVCCNLYNKKLKKVQGNNHEQGQPNITHGIEGQYITAISNGTVIGYKYFDFQQVKRISVTVRKANGYFEISIKPGKVISVIQLNYSDDWQIHKQDISIEDGIKPLYFTYRGKKKAQFLNFEIE